MAGARRLGVLQTALIAASVLLSPADAVHACDSEQGAACPMEAGFALGVCLKDSTKHESPIEISAGCKAFIELNDKCAAEIDKFCSGMAYNDDTLVCLTQWTQQSDLSADCVAALPKKEEETDAEVDKEKAEWRRKRKEARQSAQDMMQDEKDGGKKRKQRKRKGKEL
mmetsp:Transcript_10682/g.24314  ORF Transcript_10682/g.24314 Transcript_10682/m.24314 type:complete len:168 (+) Transcript_10682:49-552(+)